MGVIPGKVLAPDAGTEGGKRFRFTRLHERLAQSDAHHVSLQTVPAAEETLDIVTSHLGTALTELAERNLTHQFTAYVDEIRPRALSLALVLRGRKILVKKSCAALRTAALEQPLAVEPIALCIAALARDLGTKYFLAHFPDVVQCFADAFIGANASDLLWDPQLVAIPIFSALAAITKVLILPLISKPNETISCLKPLLAHSQYRIREMTAEACVGYIIKKTRQDNARDALVCAVVRCGDNDGYADGDSEGEDGESSSIDGVEKIPAVHGAGAALFESMKSLAGALHSRGANVLVTAFKASVEDDDEDKACRRMAIIAHSIARLCIFARGNSKSSEQIIETIVGVVDQGLAENHCRTLTSGIFLLRNSIGIIMASSSSLPDSHIRRISNVTVKSLAMFAEDQHNVFEVFACFLAIFRRAPPMLSRQLNAAVMKDLPQCVLRMSDQCLKKILTHLMCSKDARDAIDTCADALVPIVTVLCNALAVREKETSCIANAVREELAISNDDDALMTEASNSNGTALQCATQFARYARNNSIRFQVPTLDAQVESAIEQIANVLLDENVESTFNLQSAESFPNITQNVLEYARVCNIPAAVPQLCRLALAPLGPPLTSTVASTILRYDIPSEGSSIVEKLLKNLTDDVVSEDVLTGLNEYFRKPGTASLFRALSEDETRILTEKLCVKLCATTSNLRKQSALLLWCLVYTRANGEKKKSSGPPEVLEFPDEFEREEAMGIRMELSKVVPGLQCDDEIIMRAISTILHAPFDLESIPIVKEILGKIAILARKEGNLSPLATSTLSHFAVGVFCIRFKPFWEGARTLWGTLAELDPVSAWIPMQVELEATRDEILKNYTAKIHLQTERDGEEEEEDENNTDLPTTPHGRKEKSKSKKRPRSEISSAKLALAKSTSGGEMMKRQMRRAKSVFVFLWVLDEWKSDSTPSKDFMTSLPSMHLLDTSSGDALTRHLEYLKVLCAFPKTTLKKRIFIIDDMFLTLDSTLLSKKAGDRIITQYSELMEKMGGLKITENDKNREQVLRNRLLRDLCRPNSPAQMEIVQCLCASRSPELKPFRDTLLNIVCDRTFREELTLITESLCSVKRSGDKSAARVELTEPMVDLLVRICFSKMKGSRQKYCGRRSAAISFVSASLPTDSAIPKLVTLVLGSLAPVIEEIASAEQMESDGFEPDLDISLSKLPDDNLCVALLTSIDPLLQHTGSLINRNCWRRITIALFLILRKSTHSSNRKYMRSDALRLLAFMTEKNLEHTSFVCFPAFELLKKAGVASSGSGVVTSAPALLKFVAACFKSKTNDFSRRIVVLHPWVCEWTLSILRSQSSTVGTVNLVADAASGIIAVGKEDDDGNVVQGWEKQIHVLAESIGNRLQSLISSNDGMWYRSRANREIHETVTNVLSQVAACSNLNHEVLLSLGESLLFIVTESGLFGPALMSTIQALEVVAGRLSTSASSEFVEQKFLPKIIPLFSANARSTPPEVKIALCNVLRKLGKDSLRAVSYFISDMFSMNMSRVGESDLDTRVRSLTALIEVFKRALADEESYSVVIQPSDLAKCKSFPSENSSEQEARCGDSEIRLIAYSSISAIQDDDVAVRGTASYTLQLLVKWVHAAKFPTTIDFGCEMAELLVKKSVAVQAVEARRELCKVLGILVRHTDSDAEIDENDESVKLFTSLHLLTDKENLEADFFENIAHFQVHRRSRAMRRVAKKLVEMNKEEETSKHLSDAVLRFLFPLSMRIALGVSAGDDESFVKSARRSKVSKIGHNRDVIRAAIALNQVSMSYLPWRVYRKEVSTIIRRIPRETEDERTDVLYSMLVGFADAFPGCPWDESNNIAEEKARRDSFICSYLLPKLTSFISSGSFEGQVHITMNNEKTSKSGSQDRSLQANIFRAPVGVAAAKLVTWLGEKDLNSVIPALVTPLTNALRSPDIDIRKSAKKVLVDVVILLDSKYFSYVVDQVISALSSGYRKDNLIYILYALLKGIQEHRAKSTEECPVVFEIDSAVRQFCLAMTGELEEGLHASKADYLNPNASDSRLKDAAHRAAKVSESVMIIAELVDFSESAKLVLNPFTQLLLSATSSKLSSRVQEVLQKMIVGFSKNNSLTAIEGLKLAFELIHTNMPSPTLFEDDGSKDKTTLREQLMELMKDRTFVNSPGSNVLVEMGWSLLNYLLSKRIVETGGAENKKALSMIEPFVPELLLSIRSRHDSLTRISLKCAQRILRMSISNRRDVADIMAATTIEVLCRNVGVSINRGAPSHPKAITKDDGLFNTCLRAGATLIQEIGHHEKGGVKKERVVGLLQIARNVLDQNSVDARSAALACIKSTVTARIAIPEVYDTVEHVSKLAIKAQSTALKESCITVVVQFLINFPLGKKRIRQHLEFVVRNLSYEFPHGRLASIAILVALSQQLPEKNLDEEAQYFFISLASVVARDADRDCRKAAAGALKVIFSIVNDRRQFNALLKMSNAFIGGKDTDILRSGAIAITSAAESGKMSKDQLQKCLANLSAATIKNSSASWECVHSLLSCTEKLFQAQSESSNLKQKLELQAGLKSYWKVIVKLLLHKHEWVRLLASRMLGRHLVAAGGPEATLENKNEDLFCVIWARDGTLRGILKALCLHFDSNNLSEELAQCSLKNVLCISNIVWKCPQAGDVAGGRDGNNDENGMENDDNSNRALAWIISRISGMASRTGAEASAFLRRACGLRFLLQAVKWWGGDVVKWRLQSFVSPVVQILESAKIAALEQSAKAKATKSFKYRDDDDMDVDDDEREKDAEPDILQTLALSLQESVSETVGAEAYYEVYQTLVNQRRKVRNEKKRALVMETAIDPERAAKRKRRKAEKRSMRRKKANNADYSDKVLNASVQIFEQGERVNLQED